MELLGWMFTGALGIWEVFIAAALGMTGITLFGLILNWIWKDEPATHASDRYF